MTDTTLSTLHGSVLSSIPAGGEIVLSVSVGGSRVFATVAPFTAGSGLTLTGTTFSVGSIPLPNIAAGGATNGQALTWNGVVWTPTTLAAGTTYTGVAPVSINGSGAISIQQGGATTGQALVWSGSVWAPATIAVPAATSVLPLMDGTATVGTSTNYAREGHIHPSDTTRLAAASNLSDVASAGTARNNLGLGNVATLNGTAQGQIAYYNGTAWVVLAPGTSGQVLQTAGTGGNPSWVTGGSGGGTPGGANNTLQYNNAGAFAGASLSSDFTFSGGVLSISSTATDALTLRAPVAADEIAFYAIAPAADFKATITQVASATAQNLPTWATAGRPTLATGQRATGWNTDLSRFDFGSNTSGTTTWYQHTRVSDMVATSSQLFGGTGTNGVAQAITLGSGLSLSGTTLTSSGGGATFYSRPALSSFSWINQGTSTATEVSGGPIVLTIPPHTTGQNVVALAVALPTAPFTVTATMDTMAPAQTSGQYQTHLMMRSSSTGVVESMLFGASLHDVAVLNYTNVTTFNATRYDQTVDLSSRLVRFRIVNDGTNYTYLISADGYGWLQIYQETIATAGTPTHIGWGGDAGDTGTASGKNMTVGLRGWEVLASASPQAASALAGI